MDVAPIRAMPHISAKEIQQCLLNFQSLLKQSSILIHGINQGTIIETESEGQTHDLQNDDYEGEDEEDDAALLNRAFSVHSALFLSLCRTDNATDFGNNVDLANALIIAILQNGDECIERNEDEKAIALNELVSSLSSALSPSDRNTFKSHYISKEQWRKIGITNALLAIQYLLHLMQGGTSNNISNEVLKGWNTIILPILFGWASSNVEMSQKDQPASLFIKNDALRHTLLNIRPSTFLEMKFNSSCSSEIIDQCRSSCSICLNALQGITSPGKKIAMRQKIIVVICEVLLSLLEFSTKCILEECVEAVKDAILQAVLIIIRRVCYERVHITEENDGAEKIEVQPRLLSLEAVRPITGMLLPQLYGNEVTDKSERRVLEIWHEVLLLLSPHSTSFVDVDQDGTNGGEAIDSNQRYRRCQNW